MHKELATGPQHLDVVVLARTTRASFPKGDPQQIRSEFAAMRSEWDERGHEIMTT